MLSMKTCLRVKLPFVPTPKEGVQNSGGKRGPMSGMQRKADFVANCSAIGDKSQSSDVP
ncbi:hypothetical protein K3217_04450 [bacterium BD-1]|nr:hypothetical protein [Ottowia caeni]